MHKPRSTKGPDRLHSGNRAAIRLRPRSAVTGAFDFTGARAADRGRPRILLVALLVTVTLGIVVVGFLLVSQARDDNVQADGEESDRKNRRIELKLTER